MKIQTLLIGLDPAAYEPKISTDFKEFRLIVQATRLANFSLRETLLSLTSD